MARGQAAEKRQYEYELPMQHELTVLPENENVKRAMPKRIPYVKYFTLAVCVFAMVLTILQSYSKITELTLDVGKMNAELEELKSDAKALNAKKEQRFNIQYVEDVAVNQLGMVKLDKSQIVYVAISNPEKITVAASENEYTQGSGFISGIVKSFNAVVEYLN